MTLDIGDVIKSFVIGSSALVFGIFFLGVNIIPDIEVDLTIYVMAASLYFGFFNVISLILGHYLGLSLFQRLLLITIISTVVISIYINIMEVHDWEDPKRWYLQYFIIFAGHSFAYLIMIYNLELLFQRGDWAS